MGNADATATTTDPGMPRLWLHPDTEKAAIKRAREAIRRATLLKHDTILYYLEVSIERERQEALARGDFEDAMRATLAKAELRYLAS